VNFDLDDQQDLLVKTLERFTQNECPPEKARAAMNGDSSIDPPLWRKLSDLDLFGLALPEEDGGAGLGLFELTLAAETFGYSAMPGPFLEHVLATLAIAWNGDREQRARWLPILLSGTAQGTMAWAERGEHWLPASWAVETVQDRRLCAEKVAVLHGDTATVIVVATDDGFWVVGGDADGIARRSIESLDRTRRISNLSFKGVEGERLGGSAVERVLDAALLLISADAAGGARRCLEMATEYALSREQFDTTIGHFQAVKHQLANMAVEALPLRHLVWYAAAATDADRSNSRKLVALAKSHTTERYTQIARQTVELFGGIGYTWDCDVHIWLKRAVFDRTMFGRPHMHRSRVARFNGWPRPLMTNPVELAGSEDLR
jgi:alkylation response protein AidB-like acyl-CoA dehydrogenase